MEVTLQRTDENIGKEKYQKKKKDSFEKRKKEGK